MAVTQTHIDGTYGSVGSFKCAAYDVTFDSSYPTGGEAVTTPHISSPRFGIATITGMGTNDGAAISVDFDPATSKLLVYATTGQVANTTDCSDLSVQLVVFGK